MLFRSIRLGYATDTGDVTGEPLSLISLRPPLRSGYCPFSRQDIETALASLRGEIDQVPPMYSAKKQQGRKLYELARRGEQVERQPARVTIYRFETNRAKGGLLKDNLDGTYDLDVLVVCSAGTYVRTLAEDFGKRLGVGAHLAELRRTRVGDFQILHSSTLEQLQESVVEESLGQVLLAPDTALSHLPAFYLNADDLGRVRHGLNVEVQEPMWTNGEHVRLRDERSEERRVGKECRL